MRRFADIAYSLMRLVVGFLFTCHGAQKLFGVLGGKQELHNPQTLAAGIIEFGAGIAVALGIFSAVAAFIASGEMAVAYFKAHATHGFWPIMNHGELAVLYCFIFLYISTQGDRGFSVRGAFQNRTAK